MNISYVLADDELKKDVDFLHNRQKQKEYLDSIGAKYEHFELVVRYIYISDYHPEECNNCGSSLDADWEYCPYCGLEAGELYLVEDSVATIKRKFKSETGDIMPPEEEEKIKASFRLKIWYKTKKD